MFNRKEVARYSPTESGWGISRIKKMKTLILNGSPRKNGDGMAIISRMCEFLQGEVKIISAYELNISACTDCRYCREHQKCVIEDDMREVYEYLEVTDNVIISSPIHLCSLSAPLLALLGRLHCLHRHYQNPQVAMKKKNGIYILTGGGRFSQYSEYEAGQELLPSDHAASLLNTMQLVGGNVKKMFRRDENMKTAVKDAAAAITSWSGGLSETLNELNLDNASHLEQLMKILFSRLNTRCLGHITNYSTSFTSIADNSHIMGEAESMAKLLNRYYDEQVKKESDEKIKTCQRLGEEAVKIVQNEENVDPQTELRGFAQKEKNHLKKNSSRAAQRDRIRMEKGAERKRARYRK